MLIRLTTLLCLLMLTTREAHAANCSGATPSDCFFDHGGLNRSQVAVGPGLACAVSITTTTTYGATVDCFTPLAGDSLRLSSAGYIFNQTPHFNGTTASRRIHSIAIQGTANSAPGPVKLWAMRADGNLYVSEGDSKLVGGQMTKRMSDFRHVGLPENLSRSPLSLKMITVVQPPYGEAFVVGVTTQSLLYVFIPQSSRWDRLLSTNHFIAYGGPYGLLATAGASGPISRQDLPVSIFFRIAPIPQLPALPVRAYGMQIKGSGTPRDFDFVGRNQPASLGTQDAWFLSGGVGLFRSKLTTSGWSAWTRVVYYDAMSASDTAPWSIADARQLRGRRGELMYIGGPYRLRTYWTATSSND